MYMHAGMAPHVIGLLLDSLMPKDGDGDATVLPVVAVAPTGPAIDQAAPPVAEHSNSHS